MRKTQVLENHLHLLSSLFKIEIVTNDKISFKKPLHFW